MTTATIERPSLESVIGQELDTANRGYYPHPLDGLVEIDRILTAHHLKVGENVYNDCHPDRGSTCATITTTAGIVLGMLTVYWHHLDRGVEVRATACFS
jgi:hypothetical protein